ncbi:MAG: T9SS type A sorting domain-containing protein [Bacteroidales bacterium]|nr:T9SS type A sorting domain-containing protein [Bacteroidales bacterium]
MNRFMTFVLALGLSISVFAQTNPNYFISTPTFEENYGLFDVSINVSISNDLGIQKYAVLCYPKNYLEDNFEQIGYGSYGSFETIQDYLIDRCDALESHHIPTFIETDSLVTFPHMVGGDEHTLYVLLNYTNNTWEMITKDIELPSTTRPGVSGLTINKTNNVEDGTIDWNIEPNDQTSKYFFMCKKKDTITYDEQTAIEYCKYMIHRYTNIYDMCRFYANDNVNRSFSRDTLSRSNYIEGEEYMYIYVSFNGNLDSTDYMYGEFKYEEEVGLSNIITPINISIYPNPAVDNINISSDSQIDKVEIYNTLGQNVYNENINSNNVTIPVHTGTYFVRVISNKTTTVKKLIVE